MFRRLLLVCVTALVAVSACDKNKSSSPPPPNTPEVKPEALPPPAPTVKAGPPLGPEVRATVNGVAITGEQLAERLKGGSFGEKGERATAAQQQAALEQAILAELQAQKALALGYEALLMTDGGVPEATLVEQRRHDLAKQYRMKELLMKSLPTHEQIKKFYAEHTARVQAEVTLQIIAMPNRQTGEAFIAAVKAGRAFDDVANELYPKVKEPKPWAPGTLPFSAVPPKFWAALDTLKPGEVSGYIPESDDHGYVLRLIERKQNAAYTLDKAEGAISAYLQAELFEQRRAQDEKDLRAAAKIEYAPAPAAAPAPTP